MLLFERLISLYAPHVCIGCGLEADRLLCEACLHTQPRVPARCYRCRAVSRGSMVCDTCRRSTPLRQVGVVAHYDGLMKELLHQAKYERAQAGLSEMALHMASLLACFPEGSILVPVPTATSRVRQRGYDQAVALARDIAKHTGRPCKELLARLGQAHQVGSGRAERLEHLEGAFRAVGVRRSAATSVILVDDVVTTGATLETAARILKKAGIRRVDALVFAQAGRG